MSEQLVLENGGDYAPVAATQWNARDHVYSLGRSVVPSEYALHLLGDTNGKTVLTLSSTDSAGELLSDFSPGSADHVFCTGILRQQDPITTARKIRRALKPGGTAIFSERLDNRAIVEFQRIRRETGYTAGIEQALTIKDADAICRAVGYAGRRREFWLITPFVHRMGFGTDSKLVGIFQKADAALLRRFLFTRKLALHLVWEARKER